MKAAVEPDWVGLSFMSDVNHVEALRRAIQHFQAGRLPQAEALYRDVFARDANCVEAMHYLGVIAFQSGRATEAVEVLRRAAALAPGIPVVHSNLGEIYRSLGRFDDAIASLKHALALQPDDPIALSNLGNAFASQARWDEALACLRRALALRPDHTNAHNNLGQLFRLRGQPAEAAGCFREAIRHQPDFVDAHNNLGSALTVQGQFDAAQAAFERALALDPRYADAHNNLGSLGSLRGRPEEALTHYRAALAAAPQRPDIHSNVILFLHYGPGERGGEIDAELREWNRRHAQPCARFIRPATNDRSPERPLRIGYVSRDFRQHTVAFFLLPLLEAHDRRNFHVTCYSTSGVADQTTARFQASADRWRSLVGVSDEAAAALIRDDAIDVLVDLSGHTAGNRLPLFARQPAPVQVGYLGFPGPAGVETIPWRLTDAFADPPGADEASAPEQLVRLPETAWCFAPLSGAPPVAELPALRLGHMTFGCFNNFAKITEPMLQLWSEILRQAPAARLVVKNLALGNLSVRQQLQARFEAHGISTARLELLAPQPAPLDHLSSYHRVDLALDTFPYHGTTTTCEALYMGVPVVTLAGTRHVARVGVSLLTNVGLPEFIARRSEDYVATAVSAAGDLDRLAALRSGLRGRMQRSPLMDAPRFARHVEAAFRTRWRAWCAPAAPQPRST